MITVAIADDQGIVREGIAKLIEELGYKVTCRAGNGVELIDQIGIVGAPDIVVLDLSMPDMDGHETAVWLGKYHPKTAVLILTSHDSEVLLVPLIRVGIRGFLRKSLDPSDLRTALQDVMTKGYYLSGDTGARLFHLVRGNPNDDIPGKPKLDERELEFLRLCCTPLTYKGIAEAMELTPRAIDGMRDGVFQKLQVKSRVTLALFAVRNGLVVL